MTTAQIPRPSRRKHPHHDAPDTIEAFHHLARLESGRQREALREELVRAWMPMAARLARRFRNRGEALEDLEQVAYLGLINAVKRYDPELKTAFESYAVPTIVGELRRHFRDHSWGVHVPRRAQELRNRVRTAHHELCRSLDHQPNVTQLARQTELTESEVRTGLEAMDSYSPLSLDAEIASTPGDGHSLLDFLGKTETAYDQALEREAAAPCLRKLPERERRILHLRFYKGMTQRAIADELGISQAHVSRLLTRTCTQLRQQVERPVTRPTAAPGP
ncbi:SigB/SigF/SigG family RNA polymerase sigma factor [Streptomyces sp. B6B3]|uniref:SigB/SigF/SigG family RNA polymerase sigma factor n=1 Tax=Streptomyces sp. B6B3 TaxID=3153570 RepID=UPI00325DE1DE